jgi:hypothetical protein
MHATIMSQYFASLEMLHQAVAKCPESLWDDADYKNRYWHIAYHALFFTHLYLQPTQKDFVAWEKHRKDYESLGPLPWPPHDLPKIEERYEPEEVLAYLEFCREEVRRQVPVLDVNEPSGFSWLPFNKLETQFYNIRHLQHHTGQLADRLRTREDLEVRWVGMGSEEEG